MKISQLAHCAALLIPILGSGSPSLACAEDKGAPVALSAPSAPDLVRVKGGGMIRGTIAEYVPNDHVTIVTLTGELKTLPAAEVEYAGPAANAPAPAAVPGELVPAPAASDAAAATATTAAPAPPAPASTTSTEPKPLVSVQAAEAHVHFSQEASKQPLTLFLKTATATGQLGTSRVVATADSYTRVCTAPCEAKIATGSYTFGVAAGDKPVVKVKPLVKVSGEQTLVAHYQDRSGIRIGGWCIAIGGAAVGLPVMFTGAVNNNTGVMAAGGVITALGVTTGLIMGTRPDTAELTTR